ncbi:MAG: EF-hand domain-containing protein [Candidatus Saccharimonadales bacterium]
MSILDDLKAKADQNGDGKLSSADIEEMKQNHTEDASMLDQLKAKADANNDGKIGLDDLKEVGNSITDKLGEVKDKLFN